MTVSLLANGGATNLYSVVGLALFCQYWFLKFLLC